MLEILPKMIYVELVKGKIRISKDAKKARIFRHTDIDKMAKFLGPASLTDHWMTSSSVNHPHEEGFSRSFDIDPVLAAVRQQVGPSNSSALTMSPDRREMGMCRSLSRARTNCAHFSTECVTPRDS